MWVSSETKQECYKCKTNIRWTYEWIYRYFYCPHCSEDRTEEGKEL
jgi:predicted RNA-binding Zn-ribbon protein involved in translation (DUF1610 family)